MLSTLASKGHAIRIQTSGLARKDGWGRLVAMASICAAQCTTGLVMAQPAREVSAAAPSDDQANSEVSSSEPARAAIVPPKLKDFVQAAYPQLAEQQGLEADVTLHITIGVDGQVEDVTVRESAGYGFDEAAVAAARQFRFEPATRAGTPVASKILYRYSFRQETKVASPERVAPPAIGDLRGRVVAGSPPAPLAGIVLRIRDSLGATVTAITAVDGTWVASNLTPGDYDIMIEATGYRRVVQREHVESGRVTVLTYGLESSDETPLEVTVRGAALSREVTHYELTREELIRTPGTMGDAIHAVETMPSVARPPAFSGALIVRGSAPQDTQVFVEGTLVPRVFHYASLSSVIPSEMIERLEFYPSNFSVRYGRGQGGVIEVGLRLTNPDGKYHGSAQVDFINTRANAEGPVPGLRGWNFMGGFRTSYVDRWLVPVLRSSGSAIQGMPQYYDYQLYLERRLANNGVYRIGVFGAHDTFVPIEKNPKDWDAPSDAFGHVQSQLRLPVNPALDFKASWSLGKNWNTGRDENGRRNHTTYTLGTLRSELALKTGSIGIARLGTDLLYAPFSVEAVTDEKSEGGELASGLGGTKRLATYDIHGVYVRPAAYLEYELAPHRRINITAGTRLDYTRDTSRFDVAPRVAARYVVVDGAIRTVLKGGLGLFYQPPDPVLTLPGLGTPNLQSSRAIHAMVGLEQSLTKRVTLSIEGFEKELRDLIYSRMDSAGRLFTDNGARGRVWGADLMLRYRPDEHFFGWIAYTLSRSTRQLGPDEPERLFLYDQPHILNILASYRLGRGWEIGGRFRYMSGFLYRSCDGGMFDNSTGEYRCYGERRQRRLAPFHQLDLRIEKAWQFDQVRISAYMDLINVYFRSSPDYAIPNYDLSGTKPLSLSLPLLPSLGIRGEL